MMGVVTSSLTVFALIVWAGVPVSRPRKVTAKA
jgi:hypothetical protein